MSHTGLTEPDHEEGLRRRLLWRTNGPGLQAVSPSCASVSLTDFHLSSRSWESIGKEKIRRQADPIDSHFVGRNTWESQEFATFQPPEVVECFPRLLILKKKLKFKRKTI